MDQGAKVIISNIPPNFSKTKLWKKIEESSGGKVLGLDFISKSNAKATLDSEEAREILISSHIQIQFGSKQYALEFRKFETPKENGSRTVPERTEACTYEPSDKESESILRYICRTEEHKEKLKRHLHRNHVEMMDISDDCIEMKPRQGCDKDPEDCVEEFFSQYMTWNETFENDEYGLLIIHTLKDNKGKCFGNWWPKTKTVLVTGPKDIVQRVKITITNSIQVKEREASTMLACPFIFSEIQPSILRFVSRQGERHFQMSMRLLANVEIKTINDILSVHVTPNQCSCQMLHSVFKNKCLGALRHYFSLFDAWKESFDVGHVKMLRSRNPNFFKERSEQDFHMKWFLDTGTVIICGIKEKVAQRKLQIEEEFKVLSQNNDSPYSVSQNLPVTPRRRSRHISNSSDEAMISRPESSGQKVNYDLDDGKIERGVLLFVLRDLKTRKAFEKCCKPYGKAFIRSEKVDEKDEINIFINLRPEHNSEEAKLKVFELIEDFFDQFASQSEFYDKKDLAELSETAKDLFNPVQGELHVVHYVDSGTVRISGLTEKVAMRHEEIQKHLNAVIVKEKLPVDIYIAQRECGVWKKVEKHCKDRGLIVSLTSNAPCEIQYKCIPEAIKDAKNALGQVSVTLCEKAIEGFSEDQILFLRKCEKFQKAYPQTKTNQLNIVYQHFKDQSTCGSIYFDDKHISLFSTDAEQWSKINSLLRDFIVNFIVSTEDEANLSLKRLYKVVTAKLSDDPVFVKELTSSKQLEVHCFESQINGMKRKIDEIVQEVSAEADIETFREMSEDMVKHIKQQCKIYKAKKVEVGQKAGKCGIVVTCEKEDLDRVEMELDELIADVKCKKYDIEGYALFETLNKTQDHLKIERSAGCSIFLEDFKKEKQHQIFSVLPGNILHVNCQAIVNSTGQGLSFSSSSQVNKAILKLAGKAVLSKISQEKFLIPPLSVREGVLYKTHDKLPWKHIINVLTPNQMPELKRFLLNLLLAANDYGIKSLAMPTIGTGNLGLDPVTVATCMKEAFESYIALPKLKTLTDVRVIVFDPNLLQIFKVAVPKQDSNHLASKGMHVTIYTNSQESLDEAYQKMQEVCKSCVAKENLENPVSAEFSDFVKEKAVKICKQYQVDLQFEKKLGSNERCILQGPVDAVRATKEEIQKLLATGPNWSPMSGKLPYEKFELKHDSSEYKAIEIKFKKSSPQYSMITKIERIQNPVRYQQFLASKAATQKDLRNDPTKSVSKELFHGTAYANSDPICRDGFNRSFAGENVGAVYGQGVYFHVNSSYSVQYSGFSMPKCVFLAEVVTGNYTKGSRDLKCAPMNKATGRLYDSVVDNIDNPAIYVVFPDASCYPLYLITFV